MEHTTYRVRLPRTNKPKRHFKTYGAFVQDGDISPPQKNDTVIGRMGTETYYGTVTKVGGVFTEVAWSDPGDGPEAA